MKLNLTIPSFFWTLSVLRSKIDRSNWFTDTDQYLHFTLHHPLQHKVSVIRPIVHRQVVTELQDCKKSIKPSNFAATRHGLLVKPKSKKYKQEKGKEKVLNPSPEGW